MKSLTIKAMLAAGATTMAISAMSAPAEAFQVFTDRTAWQNAITGANPIVTETYDGSGASGITISSSFSQVGNGVLFAILGSTTTFGLPEGSVGFGTDLKLSVDNVPGATIGWEALDAAGNNIAQNSFGILQSTAFNFFGVVRDPGDALISSFRFTDPTNGSPVPLALQYDNTSFATPNTTAIPTPALLPGLIGMGVAAWRKRKSEAAAETEA